MSKYRGILYRTALKDLYEWFDGTHRKPLVIRGARQVGKSTLVRMFADERNLDLLEVNLERHRELTDVFRSRDPTMILPEIEGICRRVTDPARALLFLDEIQAIPEAIAALRYFYEEKPNLAVVAAGSLLEFVLSDHTFSMPVGRITYLHLGPLAFSEFLAATDPDLHSLLETWRWGQAIPATVHARAIRRHRQFLFVGGMPEAVQRFLDGGDVSEGLAGARDVQRSVLDTYIDDFAKYARHGQLARLQRVFRAIPGEVGRKVVYSRFSRDARSAEVRTALDMLMNARVAARVYHSDCPGLPLGAGRDERVFKPLFIDTGLLVLQLGLEWSDVLRERDVALINEGPLAEQYVGQELLALDGGKRPPELHFWLRQGRSGNAEVDYVVSRDGTIVPIEVKAGKSGTLKSLWQFMRRGLAPIAVRFDLNPPSLMDAAFTDGSFPLLSLPLYLVHGLPRILHDVRAAE